jgi:hypothetical protein
MSIARFSSLLDEVVPVASISGSASPRPVDRTPLWSATVAEDSDSTSSLNAVATAQHARKVSDPCGFYPQKPSTLEQTGLSRQFVEELLCRFLLVHGSSSGRRFGHATGLPFRMIEPILADLKEQLLLAYKRNAAAGDYEYILTDAGAERARRFMLTCTYAETAPVPLEDYLASVAAQSLSLQRIGANHLEAAFADMMLEHAMIERLGPAVNAGRGMFLYGPPGNGKTSIAERLVKCFGADLWIPRAIIVEGTIIRLFDPVLHVEIESGETSLLGEPLEDARWVKIRRPTVVVGGELTMDQLELRHDPVSNVSEAPLQMKSNCGVLLIDDFGRQAMPVAELLNRWIVPLEKRFDFQKLPTGKKIQVSFDQLVVFSTNLAPRELVDEAFLRRLPYKIEVPDPTPEQFRRICDLVGPSVGLRPAPHDIDRLLEKHFVATGRPMRCCHPRDLMLQIKSFCAYHGKPLEFSEEAVEFAVTNYFAVM